jgi:hypothetical protein
MPKTTAKPLTPTRVERFKYGPGGPRIQRLWDAPVPGLGIEAFPPGRRSWVFRYRFAGRQRLVTLGNVADMPLDAARLRAFAAKGWVRDSVDPKAERDAEQRAETVGDLWEQFAASSRYTRKFEGFRGVMASTMRVHVLPRRGDLPIAELRRLDVIAARDELIAGGNDDAARGMLNGGMSSAW